jgi:RNA polymerase sigma factor (sigma-70 family)
MATTVDMTLPVWPKGGSLVSMPGALARTPDDDSTHELKLAQAAAAGDGDAFAELYGRYEKRAYNLCLRILGSEDDAADATQEAFLGVLRRLPKLEGRELAFGSYVFTSARNACYDLIEKRRRAEPSDEISESAITVGAGVGGGGTGFDPGDPDDDPERHVLVAAQQEEIRAANSTLPERQREALALRELEDLSYDEIAAIMDMNRNSVAQLISRARINLRDALRGTALAGIAAASPACERALPLIALRQDGQLDGGDDGSWLDAHLAGCDNCRLSGEAMQEAGASYRLWGPVAAAPFLFRETMARAAELTGSDWSEEIARHEALRSGRRGGGRLARLMPRRRLDVAAAAVLGLLVLLGGLAVTVGDGTQSDNAVPVAETTPAETTEKAAEPKDEPAKKKGAKKEKDDGPGAPAADPDEPDSDDPGQGETLADTGSSGDGSAQRRRSRRGQTLDRTGGRKIDEVGLVPEPAPEPQPQPEPVPEPQPEPEPPPTTTPPTTPPRCPSPTAPGCTPPRTP